MKVSIKDVEHIARLSRLVLSEEEKEMFASDLDSILEYANKVGELDLEGVEPTVHVLPIKNVFREDKARPSMERGLLLKNAPDIESGYCKVPKVVD